METKAQRKSAEKPRKNQKEETPHLYTDATSSALSDLLWATKQPRRCREAALLWQEADNHSEMR